MSKAVTHRFPKKNAVAVNILRSWLSAVGVPVRVSDTPGFDLTVGDRTGNEVEVMVAVKDDEALPGPGVQVVAGAFTGRQEQRALAAFHKVTAATGWGTPRPLDRGAGVPINEETGNPRKLFYQNEEFLVAIRHNEFRRSPNPPVARWRQYQNAMNWVVWRFYYKNIDLCQRQKMDFEDVMQYARCFMVNFCSRYERATTTNAAYKLKAANEGLFMEYLRQRLSGLHQIMVKKDRRNVPDEDAVRRAFGSDAMKCHPSPADAYQLALDHPKELAEVRAIWRGEKEGEIPALFTEEPVDQAYLARNCELDTTTFAARRSSARTKLAELLGKLPHERLLAVLQGAATDTEQDFVVRKEAHRQLRTHAKSCKLCDFGVQKEKKVARPHAARGAE